MNKNKFIKSTIILIIGGFITKVLGMAIRIIINRIYGLEVISLYSLILPTFSLFITLASFGFPTAVSKVVSENKTNNKRLILSIIPISIIINIVLLFLLFIISPFLSNNLLHDKNTYFPLISIGFVLPFISLSSLVRGYFFGKQKMIPHVISNVFEQIIRLASIVIIGPIMLSKGIEIACSSIILVNIISEFTSLLVLLFFLPKNFKVSKEDFKVNSGVKDVFNTSIPTTLSRLIGNFGYFLEPIILTAILLFLGYDKNYIIIEYGIISSYVIPLLLLPSFFSMAISSALLPVVSELYGKSNIKMIKRRLVQSCIYSLLIGIPFTIIFILYPNELLNFMYKKTYGSNYVKFLAPAFLFHYVQSNFQTVLHACNKSKEAMFGTLQGLFIKSILIIILSLLNIGLYGFLIANIINIMYVTIHHYLKIKKITG